MDYMKAEQITSSKWRVLSIPFGGEFKDSKDLDAERFTIRTDTKPDWFDRRPAIWQHGKDATMKDETVGVTDDFELDEKSGWWSTLWLDRGARYRTQIEAMLRAGKAYGSSGAIGHLVRVDRKTGDILTWPHAEQTITTVPINFLSRIVPTKARDDFTSSGISLGTDLETYLSSKDGGETPAMTKLTEALNNLEHLLRDAR